MLRAMVIGGVLVLLVLAGVIVLVVRAFVDKD
jgi:hypothetical protein